MSTNNVVNFKYPHEDLKRGCSKKDKKARRDNQVQLGVFEFKQPPELKGDNVAVKKFKEIVSVYKKAKLSITSSSDLSVIARYCLLYSEYKSLLDNPYPNPMEGLTMTSRDLDDYAKFMRLKSMIGKDLLKLENNLFLTPLAKYKNIPMLIKPRKQDELGDLGFNV